VSNIPRARKRLLSLADRLHQADHGWAANEIESIVQQDMFRLSPIRRAPDQSHTPDARDREAMCRAADENADAPLREIGRQFGVDGGRVSEALRARQAAQSTGAGVAFSAASLPPIQRLPLITRTFKERGACSALTRLRAPTARAVDLRAAVRQLGRPMHL
jgi:hypothetical protein